MRICSLIVSSVNTVAVVSILWAIYLTFYLDFGSLTEQERETEGKRSGDFEEGS